MITATSVHRLTVPVVDEWRTYRLSGPILHVATRRPDAVEVWFHHLAGPADYDLDLRVFGTGHPIPTSADARHVGTAIVPGGDLVWHLFAAGPNRPTH